MSVKTVEDVLYHGLKDLLSAEKQFRDALPKLAEAADDAELAEAFARHRDETIGQIDRLERCFKLMGRASRSEKCLAADGLTSEGEDAIEEEGEPPAKDLLLVAAGRKTEAYEVFSYDDAINNARTLGLGDVATLLKETLAEERAASDLLAKIGKRIAAGTPKS